jgi:hypothetical protein
MPSDPTPPHLSHCAEPRRLEALRRQGKHIFYSLGPTARYEPDGTLTLRSREGNVAMRPRS